MFAIFRFGLFCLFVLLTACSTAPEPVADVDSCKMVRVAEMAVRLVQGGILVPGKVNQIAVQMQLDTGASTSMVDQAVAARLALPIDPYRRTTLQGLGGDIVSQNTLIKAFEIGGQEWQSMSLATGHLANRFHETPPVIGLLGADRLGTFDVELDMPHRRMTLWNVTHCEGDFIGWDEPHYVVPLVRHNPNRMVTSIRVVGHPVEALIDWGAYATVITGGAAAEVGVTSEMLANDHSGTSWGVDQLQRQIRLHKFNEVRIGIETFHNLGLAVGDLHMQEVGMLLGADFVRTRRIWLSYATRQMFVVPPHAAKPPA